MQPTPSAALRGQATDHAGVGRQFQRLAIRWVAAAETRSVMPGFEGVYHSEESRSWVRNSPLALLRDTQNRVRSVAILERSTT